MSPITEAMKPSRNSDRQSCASSGELLPKNGTAFATESPTTFVSSRPTSFGSSRRAGIAGNLVQRPVRNGLHRQPRSRVSVAVCRGRLARPGRYRAFAKNPQPGTAFARAHQDDVADTRLLSQGTNQARRRKP